MDSLVRVVTTHLMLKLRSLVYEKCNGCVIGHGSQDQHDVCFWSMERQIDEFFDELITRLNIEEITENENLKQRIKIAMLLRVVEDETD